MLMVLPLPVNCQQPRALLACWSRGLCFCTLPATRGPRAVQNKRAIPLEDALLVAMMLFIKEIVCASMTSPAFQMAQFSTVNQLSTVTHHILSCWSRVALTVLRLVAP